MSTTKQIAKLGTAALLALLLGAPATGLADKAPPPSTKKENKDKKYGGKKDPADPAKDAGKKDAPPPPAGW